MIQNQFISRDDISYAHNIQITTLKGEKISLNYSKIYTGRILNLDGNETLFKDNSQNQTFREGNVASSGRRVTLTSAITGGIWANPGDTKSHHLSQLARKTEFPRMTS